MERSTAYNQRIRLRNRNRSSNSSGPRSLHMAQQPKKQNKKGEKMKCPKCKRDMFYFVAGRHGTFVQQWSEYMCINCKVSYDNDGEKAGILNIRKLDVNNEVGK